MQIQYNTKTLEMKTFIVRYVQETRQQHLKVQILHTVIKFVPMQTKVIITN